MICTRCKTDLGKLNPGWINCFKCNLPIFTAGKIVKKTAVQKIVEKTKGLGKKK